MKVPLEDKKEPPPPPPLVRKGAAIGISMLVIPSRGVGVATDGSTAPQYDPGGSSTCWEPLLRDRRSSRPWAIFQRDEYATSTRSKPFKANFKATGIFTMRRARHQVSRAPLSLLAVQLAEKEVSGDSRPRRCGFADRKGYETDRQKNQRLRSLTRLTSATGPDGEAVHDMDRRAGRYSSEGCNDDHYQLAMCRAAQLFEDRILVRRTHSAARLAEQRKTLPARRVAAPPPVSSAYWKANGLLEAFTQAELFGHGANPSTPSRRGGWLIRR